MRKLSNDVVVSKVTSHPRYKWRVRYPDGGKRKDAWFKVKTEADSFAKGERDKVSERGTEEGSATRDEHRALVRFRDAVEDMDTDKPKLMDAVEHYLNHLSVTHKPMTCAEVADKLIDRLEAEGKGKRHIDGSRSRMDRFNAEYGDRMASDITTEIVDDFITNLGVAPKTMINYRLALSGLFNHAVRLKAATENPVTDSIRPKVLKKEPGILKPKQVAALLSAAGERTLPAIAISFFAGLRRSEIEKLNWSEIDFDENTIEVKAPIAKKEKRRFVAMSANLRAWLLPYNQHEGAVVKSPQIHRKGVEKAREGAGIIKWPDNAGRHSFASYHLAEYKDAGKTSFELGHPDPRQLYADYRALVKEKDAHTYWSITPQDADNITNIKAS